MIRSDSHGHAHCVNAFGPYHRRLLHRDDRGLALEATTRTCIATGEQIFRSHRNDPAFDFGPVIVSFAKAMEEQCNVLLRRLLKNAPPKARLAKLQDSTRDVLEWKPLSLGELGHVMGGEWELNGYVSSVIAGSDKWFTQSLPAILGDFASVRNPGTHSTSVDRDTATRWRDRLMGVGCEGDFVKLARVRAG